MYVFLICLTLFFTACDRIPKEKPRILVLLVEGLSFDSLECEDINSKEFPLTKSLLCQKSSRMTHFYANSSMTQSNVATLLSGLDPREHKVTNNGNNALLKSLVTLPEKAIALGYRTAFFTDSPAVIKKSGLDQGIERFESLTEFTEKHLLSENLPSLISNYTDWISDNTSKPTLTFLYTTDMANPLLTANLPIKSTENSNTERLVKNFESLFKEILKKNSTVVYILGVSGKANLEGRKLIFNDNLYSENTHLSAYVYNPFSESKNIDALISFVSIHKMIENLWRSSKTAIVSEVINQIGGWRTWFHLKDPLVGLRRDKFFTIKDADSYEISYNFYEDKEEIEPIEKISIGNSTDNMTKPFYQSYEFATKVFQIDQKDKLTPQRFFQDASNYSKNSFIVPWLFEILAQKGFWSEMHSDKDYSRYAIVTETYLMEKEKKVFPLADPCFDFFNSKAQLKKFFRKCTDTDLFQTIKWVRGDENSFADVRRNFSNYVYVRNLKKINAIFRFNWDISDTLNLELSNSDLFLWRKENIPFRKRLLKSISQKSIPQD